MKAQLQAHIDNLYSKDRSTQGASFQELMKLTEQPVDWADDVWDSLLELLEQGNNRGRAIAAQVLCNLAKSDPGDRMASTLPKLMQATKDEKFVTARHSLQALWRVGVVNGELAARTVDGLAQRFEECIDEKNCTLIRYDIVCVMRKIYDNGGGDWIVERAISLIETESNEKYAKKYRTAWKDVLKSR